MAVGLCDKQPEAAAITGGRAKLKLKQSWGDAIDETFATDIVDYVYDLSKHLQCDVHSSRSIYIT